MNLVKPTSVGEQHMVNCLVAHIETKFEEVERVDDKEANTDETEEGKLQQSFPLEWFFPFYVLKAS
jgi:hypothetical protein